MIYTDGSKTEEGVGAAAVCRQDVSSQSLPNEASIYTAETYAIQLALAIIQERIEEKYVTMSDSSSVLCSIGNYAQRHPIIRKIQHKIAALRDVGKFI